MKYATLLLLALLVLTTAAVAQTIDVATSPSSCYVDCQYKVWGVAKNYPAKGYTQYTLVDVNIWNLLNGASCPSGNFIVNNWPPPNGPGTQLNWQAGDTIYSTSIDPHACVTKPE